MEPEFCLPQSREQRLQEVLVRYVDAAEAGRAPDPKEFAARYPEFACELEEYFANRRHLDQAAAPLRALVQPPLERQLGDFHILREVGRGGMGIVYEAEQLSLARRVALKVLPFAIMLDPKQLQRFKHEAQAAAHLHHPNIVPVFAVGCERGVHYYAMQFIDGQTVAQLIRELRRARNLDVTLPSPPSVGGRYRGGVAEDRGSKVEGPAKAHRKKQVPEEATTIEERSEQDETGSYQPRSSILDSHAASFFRTVAQLGKQGAEALEHAHEQGIIHRDIKPANLMVDGRGNLWITDFGLAQFQKDNGLTLTGDLVGTLRYMSPEQGLAKRRILDHRADIYSLGATLYELLTLQPSFAGQDRHELLRQIALEDPAPPRRLHESIPADLETIVLKAMAKDPEGRYASAQELADDLGRFLADQPILARRPSPLKRTRRWLRRHRAVVAATLLTAFFGWAGFTFLLWRVQGLTQAALDEAQTSRDAEKTQRTLAEEHELIGRRHLYAAQMNLVQHAWEEGYLARVLELLESQRPQPGQEDLRSFDWYYFWRLCHTGLLATLDGHGGRHALAFAPDGKTLAVGDQTGAVRIWDLTARKERTALKLHTRPVLFLAYAPDGQAIASAGTDGEVRIWNFRANQEQILQAQPGPVNCFAYSLDGKTLACGCADGSVWRWDLTSGQHQGTLRNPGLTVTAMAFDRVGKTIAIGGGPKGKEITLWNIASGDQQGTLEGHRGRITSLAFAENGQTLVSASDDWTIRVWDRHAKKCKAQLEGHAGGVYCLAVAADGYTLASGGNDGTVRLWDLRSGTEHRVARGHAASVGSLAFAADGKTLASGSADGIVKLWDITAQPDNTVLKAHQSIASAIAFDPRGKLLATSGSDQSVRLWDAATLQMRALVPLGKANAQTLAFSSDGGTLAILTADRALRLWDPVIAKERDVPPAFSAGCTSLTFLPNAHTLALGLADGSVGIWDLDSGREQATYSLHQGQVIALASSADGRLLASAGDDRTVKVWDPANAEVRRVFHAQPQGDLALAFSPDGKMLAATSHQDWIVKLWDVTTGQERPDLKGHAGSPYGLAFARDGRTLATGGMDKTVKLWDPITGQLRVTLKQSHDLIFGLAFSPDGGVLAIGRRDGTVIFWRAATEQEVVDGRSQ